MARKKKAKTVRAAKSARRKQRRVKPQPKAPRSRRPPKSRSHARPAQPQVQAEELIRLDLDAHEALAAHQNLPPFPIVGVGASAGGLEAFSQVIQNLPEDIGFAIVLVQHLAPNHESFLSELLAAATPVPVVQAEDRMQLQTGQIYVAPPGVQIEIKDQKLYLVPRPHDRSQHMPIDHLFRSLAEYAQNRCIGVVLSGSASDGSMGLRDVKAAGGITIAQEPSTAKFDSMPRAAISTGIIDLVLTPEQISHELPRIAQQAMKADPAHDIRETLAHQDEHLQRILTLLRNASGVDFTHYKLPTIRRRLQRRVVLHKLETIPQYLQFLNKNPVEIQALYEDLLIHVTRFFRDPESYQALLTRVFPELAAHRTGEQPIRIWIPGCSTGEEAYSVAIALMEFLGENATSTPIQIFATDVSEAAIERARSGIYPENISADVSAERQRRFFSRIDGSYRISKQIRDLCVFARQDLTRDPPFSKLDLIVCRNVMIYLGPVLQRRLMTVFHYALKESGFLILGNAETIGAHADLFSIVDKRHKIYVKKRAISRPADLNFPVHFSAARIEAREKGQREPRPANTIQNEANRVILSRYAPPGVLVGPDLKILQFRGHTGAYLEPPPGEASLDLLKMAREGLLYGLRTAINEARKTGVAVRKTGLRVKHNGGFNTVNLEVIPINSGAESHHFLILFERKGGARAARQEPVDEPATKSKRGERHVSERAERLRLERELAASREYLQSVIQDLESANEELQSANEETLSANEELQSTNEELDTAREELQSTNEELNTVNEELQARNEELSRANSDLLNLLGSVQIAIVMVNNDLRIRRFTPMAEKVLNLIPTDIGRPIGDIKPNIECPDLEQLITEAIDSVTIKERECRDRHHRLYVLRVRPYKNAENRIDGAVLALFDVDDAGQRSTSATTVAAAAAAAFSDYDQSAREAIKAVITALPQPMLLLDERARVLAASAPMLGLVQRSDGDGDGEASAPGGDGDGLIGRSVYEIGQGRLNCPELHELLERRLPHEHVVKEHRVQLVGDGDGRPLRVHARRIGGEGRPFLSVLAFSVE